jgi:hypothetical protein
MTPSAKPIAPAGNGSGNPVEPDQVRRERILPRYQFEVRIGIEVVRNGKAISAGGWSRDLSESGVGAFAGGSFAVGEKASLKIPLPNRFELVVPAIVTRAQGTHYGFQFTALSGQQRKQLRDALAGSKPITESAWLY